MLKLRQHCIEYAFPVLQAIGFDTSACGFDTSACKTCQSQQHECMCCLALCFQRYWQDCMWACSSALQAESIASRTEADRLGITLQVVRSVLWLESGVLLSGGEDARLVQWHAQPAAAAEPQLLAHKPNGRSSSAATRKDHSARQRHSPY